MSCLDLFSGIGGCALAAEWLGWETVAFCEIEPFCRAVLAHHWPEVPIHNDITKLDGTVYRGRVDLVCGGFPCQDISVAGKGAGLEGARSGLWFEMLRVIREVRPRWVVAENVPALFHRGADIVLGGLEEAGYTCWPLVVGADDVGAPHRRKRVWIVGRLDDTDRVRRQQQPTGAPSPLAYGNGTHDGLPKQTSAVGNADAFGRGGWQDDEGQRATERNGAKKAGIGLADTGCDAGAGRGKPGDVACATGRAQGEAYQWERLWNSSCDGSATLADACCAGRQVGQRATGQRPHATTSRGGEGPTFPGLGRAAHGLSRGMDGRAFPGWPARPGQAQHEWEAPRTGTRIPNRARRLKALGNSVVPQVAYTVLRAIAMYEAAERAEQMGVG